MKTYSWRRPVGLMIATVVSGAIAQAVLAAPVEPPPLPPGSAQVQVTPGLSPVEVKRSIRAHHHGGHHKKDYTRDDSLPGRAPAGAGQPARQ